MGRLRTVLVGVVGAVSLVIGGGAATSAHETQSILEFHSMKPVMGAAVGTVNSRGIVGGGLPWVITSGSGELDRNGTLHIRVTGLVIPVPPFNGTNPVTQFGAIVSCQTPQGVVNVSTPTAPANAMGDSIINAKVSLPHPCKHPIVFVTSPGGAWFAMSRGDADEEEGD